MPSTQQLLNWDQQHYWHSFTQMADYQPWVIQRAEGCKLIDIHGREFIDGVSSMWCNVHGHCHPKINQAIRDQLEQISHCTSLGMGSANAVQLAHRLVEVTPEGLNHVFYSSDGSSAIESALKMAFQFWRQREQPQPKRTKFVALGDAYHGDTIGGVSVGGVDQFTSMFAPLLFDVIRVPAPDLYRLPEGVSEEDACGHYLKQVEQVLIEHGEEIAALVVEPLVQGAAGILVHPVGYLRGLRELTRKYNTLLIADEVAVGFGRTGTLFACEQEQVIPDLMCLGKGLTGGYLPMAATLTTDEIYESFLGDATSSRAFYHGHTYAGNALAAAAALATLDLFEEEKTLQNVKARSEQLSHGLQKLSEHPVVGHVRQKGLMAGIELVQERETKTAYAAHVKRGASVCRRMLDRGIWIRPLGDVLVVMPPLSISDELLKQILDGLEYGLVGST